MSVIYRCRCGQRARLGNKAIFTKHTCESCGRTDVCDLENTRKEMNLYVAYAIWGAGMLLMAIVWEMLADVLRLRSLTYGRVGRAFVFGALKGAFIVVPPWRLLYRRLRPSVKVRDVPKNIPE